MIVTIIIIMPLDVIGYINFFRKKFLFTVFYITLFFLIWFLVLLILFGVVMYCLAFYCLLMVFGSVGASCLFR